jgi:ribose transport system permease protein
MEAAPGTQAVERPPRRGPATRLEGWRAIRRRYPNIQAVVTVWLVFASVFVAGAAVGWVKRFDQVETALILAVFAVVVAYGQNLVILTGGIDLSVPFAITGTSVVLAELSQSGGNGIVVMLIVLGMATLVGTWNGLGIAFLRISPLIMTLATNIILLGLILAYTKGTPKGVAPKSLVNFMTGAIGPFKTVLVVGLLFAIVGSVILLNTTFGRYVFAIGNSNEVSFLSGVPVRWVTVAVYAAAGLCYGLAGIMLSGWNEQASFQMGDPYLFPSIAAVVLGGTSILGGRGNFAGTVGGAALFSAIGTVLAGTNVPQSTRNVVIGVVLIIAVALIQRERITD